MCYKVAVWCVHVRRVCVCMVMCVEGGCVCVEGVCVYGNVCGRRGCVCVCEEGVCVYGDV